MPSFKSFSSMGFHCTHPDMVPHTHSHTNTATHTHTLRTFQTHHNIGTAGLCSGANNKLCSL